MTPTEWALSCVKGERERQDRKWGEQNHDLTVWMTVLGEEVGETNEAAVLALIGAVNAKFGLACEAVLQMREGTKSLDDVREEMVQVAAVAVATIEFLDRGLRPTPGSLICGDCESEPCRCAR